MPYADLPDIRIHYLDNERDAEPIIFLHGFLLDHRSWVTQTPCFDGEYRTILMDSRGHGRSEAPPTNYARSDRVRDALNLLDYLKIDKAHLVGCSMGGSTGIGFALAHSDRLLSLTLVGTGAAGYDTGPKIAKIDKIAQEQGVEEAKRKWIATSLKWFRDDQKQISDALVEMMNDHSGAIWIDPRRGKYPRTYDLDHVHNIKVPTLIIVGQLDRIFLPLARKLHREIKGSQLIEFESVGHMVNMESPNKFNDVLKHFLESLRR